MLTYKGLFLHEDRKEPHNICQFGYKQSIGMDPQEVRINISQNKESYFLVYGQQMELH